MKKERMKIRCLILSAVLLLSAVGMPVFENCDILSFSVSAEENISDNYTGFKKQGSDTYYYVNGKAVKSQVKKIDGEYYLFGTSGTLLKDGIFSVNDSKYHTDKDGIITRNEWVKINDKCIYRINRATCTDFESHSAAVSEPLSRIKEPLI